MFFQPEATLSHFSTYMVEGDFTSARGVLAYDFLKNRIPTSLLRKRP